MDPVGHVPAVPEILSWPEVPAVLARTHVPANPATGQLEVLAIVGSALVPEVLARAGVPETLAQPPLQHDFRGVFQQLIPNWNSQIWIAMSKSGVFKKHSLQHQILNQTPGQGYAALFQIISNQHPVLGRHPTTSSTPVPS